MAFPRRQFGNKPKTDGVTLLAHRLSWLEVVHLEEDSDDYVPLGSSGLALAPALRTGEVDEEGLEQTPPMLRADLEARGLTLTTALEAASVAASDSLRKGGFADGLYMWRDVGVQIVALVGHSFAEKVSGVPVAMFPAEGFALLTGSENLAGLQKMLELAEGVHDEDEDAAISLRAISWKDEAACAWLPPPWHPLHQRFKRAAARARFLEAADLDARWSTHEMPLAHLEVDEARGELVAGWVRGSTVLMPRPDRVVLFDTNDTALPRLEVDFETLHDALPQCFTSLADELRTKVPRVLRAIGMTFPTVTEREFLRERMAWKARNPGAHALESVEAKTLLARFDTGEPILAQAAVEPAGAVHLVSADFKQAFVSRAQFESRMERRRPHEQQRYALSFAVMQNVRGALGLPGSDSEAQVLALASSLSVDDEREPLISSADVELHRQEASHLKVADALEGVAGLWAPARFRPVVRPCPKPQQRDVRVFSREAREGFCVEVETSVEDETALLFQSFKTPDRSDAVWRTAHLNLRAATLGSLFELEPGLYADPWPDGLAFSRLFLMPELVTACRVEGQPLLFAPSMWTVLVVGSQDEKGLKSAMARIDAAFDELDVDDADELLVGWVWTVAGGELVRAKVPRAVETWSQGLCARIEALRGG